MLNEKRVKHMVKLAVYESKSFSEDYKVSSFFKGDYISFNVLCSLLWATVGFVIVAGLLGIVYMEVILDAMTLKKAFLLLVGVIVAYVILMLIYGISSYFFYKKKHLSARQNIKKYGSNLETLEKMYEKEEM